MGFLVAAMILIAAPPAAPAEAGPEAAIRRVLQQWPKDFNARNKPGAYSLFAADLVATYPGQPDRTFEAMCKHLAAVLDHPKRRFRYDVPEIHQILVSGDLAVVRLTWTLRITEAEKPEIVVRERGMDVFKRQKDGAWKISVSYAYPDPADKDR
jgi:uncharacterized protein (TIGR02246 family)